MLQMEIGLELTLFDKTLPAFLSKSCSYAYYYFLSIIFLRKQSRFVSKQGQPQPQIHWKARDAELTTVKWSLTE